MRAGKLDRQITIERLTEIVGPSGAVSDTWAVLKTIRAELMQQSAEEVLAGAGEAETGTVIFRVRWFADPTTADRLIYDGAAYDLKAISEIGRKRGLELRAVAVS